MLYVSSEQVQHFVHIYTDVKFEVFFLVFSFG